MILALDTTLGNCSVALGDHQSGILASANEARTRGHAEAIVPMIEGVVGDVGRPRSEISGIVCTTGPGSFTGLRVGLAAAKGLALGLDIPAAGVPTLEALAASLLFEDEGALAWAGTALAVIEGPRDGFIVQAFSIDKKARQVMPEGEIYGLTEDQASNQNLETARCAVGPAARRLVKLAAGADLKVFDRQPEARVLCQYVLESGEDRFAAKLSPVYFRPPHAEPAKPPPWMKLKTEMS